MVLDLQSVASPAHHLERCVAPPSAPGLLADRLLREEARSSNHRKAAVRQLFLLHEGELSRVLGLKVERVEAQITRVVARLECR